MQLKELPENLSFNRYFTCRTSRGRRSCPISIRNAPMSAIVYSTPKGRKKRKSAPRELKLMEVEGVCAKMSYKNQKKKIFKLTASFSSESSGIHSKKS